VSETLGGGVMLAADCATTAPGTWAEAANPRLAFAAGASTPNSRVVIKPTDAAQLGSLTPSIAGSAVLTANAPTSGCTAAPATGPLYAIAPDGTTYVNDRRVAMLNNTLEAPATAAQATPLFRTECPNVPKTWLNAKTCVPSPGECAPLHFGSANVTLDDTMLRRFYSEGGKHVHYVHGLMVDIPPCNGARSRWAKREGVTEGACSTRSKFSQELDSSFDIPADIAAITAALKSGDTLPTGGDRVLAVPALPGTVNAYLHDVTISETACSVRPGIMVWVDGVCWQHVNKDEYNVYDFTYFANAYPGAKAATLNRAANPVQAIAIDGHAGLDWEATIPKIPMRWGSLDARGRQIKGLTWAGKHGAVTQWYQVASGGATFQTYLLGRRGDTVDFTTLPGSVQIEKIATAVGAEAWQGSPAAESCGSPGEVANVPALGNHYRMALGDEQKETTWGLGGRQRGAGRSSTAAWACMNQ